MVKQQDVIDFMNDPENIKKAVEGSMDKRIKVLDSTKSQTDNTELDKLVDWILHEPAYTKAEMRDKIAQLLKEQDIKSRIDELMKMEIYEDETMSQDYISRRTAKLESKL